MAATEFERVLVTPEGHEGLAFSFEMPKDWRKIELPSAPPQFDKPVDFLPLIVSMAAYGAVVFSVGARPAYADGTVSQWLDYTAREQGFNFGDIESVRINNMPAVTCAASQSAEVGLMQMRCVMLEDGGRLFAITVMAPEAIWPSVAATLQHMAMSFKLQQARGGTAQLGVGDAPTVATASAPTSQSAPESKPTTYAEMAIADDASSLSEDDPVQTNLRERGIGLTPRVIETDKEQKCVMIGAGAIEATLRVPFGWHAIDDGKRLLIFDDKNEVQANLTLIDPEGVDDNAILDATLAEMSQDQSNLEHLKTEVEGMKALLLRGLAIDGEQLEQAYLLKHGSPRGLVLKVRVTVPNGQIARGGNLAEVLLRDLKFASK